MPPYLPLAVPTPPITALPSSARPRAATTLAITFLALIAIATILVNVHPLEDSKANVLLSKTAESLLKTALASQRSDLARHRAAEAKAKAAIHHNEASAEGKPQDKTPMSDAALFKQALQSQSKDIAKAKAETAKIKKASHHKASLVDGLGSTKQARLSDAKLFQDALKSQRDDSNAHMNSLKKDITAQVAKSQWQRSKKAKQAKIDAELRLILGANHQHLKALDKSSTLKANKARKTQLALVRVHHAHHKAVQAAKAKAAAATTPKAVAHAHASKQSKIAEELKSLPRVPVRKAAPKQPQAKHMTAEQAGVQVLNTNAEKKLFALLNAADGGKKRPAPAAAPKDYVLVKPKSKAAAAPAPKATHAPKEKTVRVSSTKKQVAGHGWLDQAMHSADSHLHMTHSANSYKRAEVARSDAIEDSLLDSPSPPSHAARRAHRGRK